MANRITAWCIDCEDPNRLAAFWAAVLGWVVTDRDEEGTTIKPSAEAGWGIDFFVVPDGPKQNKNRVHLDVSPTDRDQDAELQRLLELGARRVDIGQGEVAWHVLADPEATSSASFAAGSSQRTAGARATRRPQPSGAETHKL